MSLQSLAVVELQLVMQCLDRLSLLALARCSRALLAAALHPFPWKHVVVDLRCSGSEPPPRSHFVQFLRAAVGWAAANIWATTSSGEPSAKAAPLPSPLTMARRYNSSLLRFGHCNVRWLLESSGTAAELRAQVAEVAALPRIVELGATSDRSVNAPRLLPADAVLLVDGLLHHSAATLSQLNLYWNQLGDEGAVALSRLLRAAPLLRALLLDYTAIGAAGFRALGKAVGLSSSLEVLTLTGMPAGDAGALAIAGAIAASTSLQHICLRRCEIGDDGAVALANALHSLSPSSRLNSLDLSYNDIGDKSAAALIDALYHWSSSRSNNAIYTGFCLSLVENGRLTTATLQRAYHSKFPAGWPCVRVKLSHSLEG